MKIEKTNSFSVGGLELELPSSTSSVGFLYWNRLRNTDTSSKDK